MSVDEQIKQEDENNRKCIEYGSRELGF